jgi:hypothetical protein
VLAHLPCCPFSLPRQLAEYAVSHWKYIIGDVIVSRCVSRSPLHHQPTSFLALVEIVARGGEWKSAN